MAKEPGPSIFTFELQNSKPKACANCRRRKIKCDSKRPKCGPCSRSMGFQDCEYVDDGPSKTQQLEDQIAFLEARIEELEKPKDLRYPFMLPDSLGGTRRAASLPTLSRGGSPVHRALSHIDLPSPTLSFSEASRHLDSIQAHRPPQGIPLVELEALVLNFQKYCRLFGFFLHIQNFTEAALGRSGPRPSLALLHAVYLWAVHLSGNDDLIATFEARYLSRALRSAVDSLSSAGNLAPDTILHTIQAEVLLSQYFFRTTRFLEGKYHMSAAISLVLSSGLHRLRSSDTAATSGSNRGLLGAAFQVLPPPRDAIEDMERIAAFWTVLTMNNCWTTADGSPSNMVYTKSTPDARIDTPWPVDVELLSGQELPELSFGTVTTFLSNVPDNATSGAALHAKSAILFEQASRLADLYRPDMSPAQLNDFYRSFNSMDTLIENFIRSLPSLFNTVPIERARTLFLVHALARVALIQLHNPFVDVLGSDYNARRRALEAARGIVADLAVVPVNDFRYVDPIMGTLFMATAQVFIAELRRYRRLQGAFSGEMDERALMDGVETVLAVMNVFASTCRLMDSQLHIMRRAYLSLQ
ncbi:Zn(2)-Cys(6) binuclear cluster domain-containing protein [Mycena amicta]|nr:Zn(2)-Cys(6) binuclear cluster domain-containing protein [Mycena amicta]